MKTYIALLLSLLMVASASAQDLLEVDFYQIADGYVVFANNNEFAPVSVEINLDLHNITFTLIVYLD